MISINSSAAQFPSGAFGPAKGQTFEVNWSPLKPGGANFKTHHLESVSHDRVVFASTAGARLFAGAFGFIGFIVMVIGLFMLAGTDLMPALIMAPFGALFLAVGIWMYRTFDEDIIFDRTDGLFWKKHRPDFSGGQEPEGVWCRIDDIAAIQLLTERVSSKNGSYESYELNLVLQDGRRINVVDHGSTEQIDRDATKLGEFLGVPVWDGR